VAREGLASAVWMLLGNATRAEGVTGIQKGTNVFVAGELELSNVTGEDGGVRMSFRVVADMYRILADGRTVVKGRRRNRGSLVYVFSLEMAAR
jgi:hypothetical protein